MIIKLRVYEFGKACGFVAVTDNTTRKKNQNNNQLKQPKQKQTQQIDLRPRFRKKLCKLRKENKFTNKAYFELYPSEPIPPRLYGTV